MPHQCTNCGRTFADGSKEMLSGCPDCGGNKFQFAPKGGLGDGDAGADGSDATTAAGSSDSSGGAVSRAAETVRDWVGDDRPDREDAEAGESTEFDEWPDTARRPADRSTAAKSSESDGTSATRSSGAGGTTPTPSDVPDESEPSTSAETSTSAKPSTSAETSTSAEPSPRGEASGPRRARTEPESGVKPESEDAAQANARSEVVSPDDLPSRSDGVDATREEGDDRPPEHGRVVKEPSDDERPSLEQLRDELNDQFESIKIIQPGQYELNLMELYDREEYIVSLQEDGRYVIDVPDSWRDGDE